MKRFSLSTLIITKHSFRLLHISRKNNLLPNRVDCIRESCLLNLLFMLALFAVCRNLFGFVIPLLHLDASTKVTIHRIGVVWVFLSMEEEYERGDNVMYTSNNGEIEIGKIVEIHRDDIPPYYTIQITRSGKMKVTDSRNLTILPESECENEGLVDTSAPKYSSIVVTSRIKKMVFSSLSYLSIALPLLYPTSNLFTFRLYFFLSAFSAFLRNNL